MFSNDKIVKYLSLAESVASFSKDKSTQVGALIVGPAGEIRSTGYNGAPRGCTADEDNRSERPEKYFWFEHAERNAIYNAARCGTPTDGCYLFVTHVPCMDCARAIVQSGIKAVYTNEPGGEFLQRWKEHSDRVQSLFRQCKVELTFLNPK